MSSTGAWPELSRHIRWVQEVELARCTPSLDGGRAHPGPPPHSPAGLSRGLGLTGEMRNIRSFRYRGFLSGLRGSCFSLHCPGVELRVSCLLNLASTLELVCRWSLGLPCGRAWHWSLGMLWLSSSSVAPQRWRLCENQAVPTLFHGHEARMVPTAKLPAAGMAPRRTYLHSSLAFMRAMKE